jgi:hypothetical protein
LFAKTEKKQNSSSTCLQSTFSLFLCAITLLTIRRARAKESQVETYMEHGKSQERKQEHVFVIPPKPRPNQQEQQQQTINIYI